MCNQNEWIVREAFLAYDKGDVARMMTYVHPDLDWIYLEPSGADARPAVRQGRGELEAALRRQSDLGLRPQVEEVVAAGEQVLLVTRTPGIDKVLGHRTSDLSYDVVTVRDGLIVELRACKDRDEARTLVGIS
jgi:ketosteroid isomerase-like protein